MPGRMEIITVDETRDPWRCDVESIDDDLERQCMYTTIIYHADVHKLKFGLFVAYQCKK